MSELVNEIIIIHNESTTFVLQTNFSHRRSRPPPGYIGLRDLYNSVVSSTPDSVSKS